MRPPRVKSIRDLLVESIREAEDDLVRRRAALDAYDAPPTSLEAFAGTPVPRAEPSAPIRTRDQTAAVEAKSRNGQRRATRRSPELMNDFMNEILVQVSKSPERRARVPDILPVLVESGYLDDTKGDREFVRYVLRKLVSEGRLVTVGRGLFEAPATTLEDLASRTEQT